MSVILKNCIYRAEQHYVLKYSTNYWWGNRTVHVANLCLQYTRRNNNVLHFFLSDEINYNAQIMWLQKSSILLIMEIVFASQ